MKKCLLMIMMMGLFCAASAVDTIAYHGQLTKANGSEFSNPLPLTITFAFYADATGGTPLWGRTMPVKVEKDGTFFVELADNAGSTVSGCQQTQLTEALQGRTQAYIGLTPAGSTELAPRTLLLSQPRALVARTAAKVESVKAQELKAETVKIEQGTLNNVTAPKIATAQAVTLAPTSDQTLSASANLRVTGSVSGYKTASDQVTSNRKSNNCGSILWYQPSGTRGDQWGSIVYPRGTTLRKDGSKCQNQYFGKEL